jgi:cardiolipin synthase
LIDAAQRDIILVSFASFRVADVVTALERAARRGVVLTFVLESAEDSAGRLKEYGENAYQSLKAFPGVKFVRWPLEKRPHGAVLHAKAVVVDGQQSLVTRANLTGNAIESNLELGLLVRGGDSPAEIRDHLLALIRAGELVEI